MDMMTSQFESLTLRYNNYKDSVAIVVDYSNTTMSATQQADFEAKLAALPVEVQRAISELTIYDGQIPGMGETTLGLANSADQTIALKYEANNLNLVSTVLHEMTHIIDFKSGLYSETTDRNTDGSLSTVMAFSDTQEFLDVYHTYFDRPDVWSYYRDNSEEAFAEGLSQYIMHRLFGTPYSTYIANPYTGDAYPDDGSGYSPFAATEFYFASLYNRLFEYPRTAQVVPYFVTTTTTAPVNGQVIYGAMPEETTTTIPYTTVYVGDTSFAYDPTGQTDRVQAGVNGTETIRTTYSLDSNNQLVATQTVISSTPVQNQIITKGTQPTVIDTSVPMTIVYQEVTDGSLGDWQVKVLDLGQDGLIRTTTSYTVDSQTGQVSSTRTQNQLTEMLPMTVQYQIGSSKVTAIPYQTRYVIDNSLAAGTQVIVQEGVNGSSTESVQSYNFIQDGSNSRFDAIVYASPVVVAAQDQVIAVGGQDQVSDQTVAKTIVYQEVSDGSLGDWQVKVLDGGQDGLVRTTTSYSVDPVTGIVTPSTTEATITAMKPMIVQYQVGKSKLSAIPFLTEYITDDSLAVGLEKVIQEGVGGTQIETVQSFNFIQDGANSHFENIVYSSPTIVVAAVDQVIARGTKVVEVVVAVPEVVTPKPEASEVISPEKGQTAPTITVEAIKAPAQKKAKVEAVPAPKESLPTTGDDQNLLVTLMSSLLLMSLGLGLKKKEDE